MGATMMLLFCKPVPIRGSGLKVADENTRRFLRGRSLNVEGAFQQFQEATEIRRAADAVKTYNMIDINDFEQTRNIVSIR